MLAVDTNVLVRVFTRDDPGEAARAIRLLRSSPVWVAKTVLLETEWVLRTVYEFSPDRVLAALRGLAGLEQVELEEPLQVARALAGYEAGLDFADALHLASAEDRRFASFDQKLAKRARRADWTGIVVPP
ncbi:MAG: type II toxin-antitoxin system VapC family toxin [Terriglobia bacterium]